MPGKPYALTEDPASGDVSARRAALSTGRARPAGRRPGGPPPRQAAPQGRELWGERPRGWGCGPAQRRLGQPEPPCSPGPEPHLPPPTGVGEGSLAAVPRVRGAGGSPEGDDRTPRLLRLRALLSRMPDAGAGGPPVAAGSAESFRFVRQGAGPGPQVAGGRGMGVGGAGPVLRMEGKIIAMAEATR